MAIYRTGQASMDADGYITGYGTKWKTALTLIRPGATIVFASNPVAYATIIEIVSDTSLRAISSGGVVVPKGDYVILLHDSLTVDGLAQDVAETLRYYQGQETMYQEFVEFLKGFDWQRMEQLGEKAYADAKAAEASANAAKASETNANASKNAAAGSATTASQKATEAANSAGAAKTSETNANASKTAAANSAAAAASSATTAGQHKDAAAASASAARTSEGNASSSKNAAAASASAAKTSETNAKASEASATASKNAAKTSEDNAAASKNAAASSASAAAGSATLASNSAATAKSEADRAADLAKQLDATNLMRKDANLSDVVNKDLALRNVDGFMFKRDPLGSSDRLNDIAGFDKVGIYFSSGNEYATEANNYPVAFAGVLVVMSSRANGAQQTMQYYYPYIQPEVYYARCLNKRGSDWVWTSWERYESASYLRGDTGLTANGVLGPANANDIKKNCFFAGAGNDSQNYKLPYAPGIAIRRANTTAQLQIDAGIGTIWTRGSVDGGEWSEWRSAAMENSVVTFQNTYLDAKSDGDRSASGIMNGRLLSANGSTVRHYWRVYSEIRSDNKTYMTFHLRGANGADKYLGFNQDGDLSGINVLKCSRVESASSLKSSTSWPAVELEKTTMSTGDIGRRIVIENNDSSLRFYFANATDNAGRYTVDMPKPNNVEARFIPYEGGLAINGTSHPSNTGNDMNTVHQGWRNWVGSGNGTPTSGNVYGSLFTQSTQGLSAGSAKTNGVNGLWYQQRFYDTSNRIFSRVQTNAAAWSGWVQLTTTAVSDERLKDVMGSMNVECALDNINRMEFKLFKFKEEHATKENVGATRRGVISQQIRMIDKEYTREIGGYYHLDQTPMLLDGLAAIKALRARDEENKERIAKLEGEVEELKAMVAALIAK